MKKILFLGLIIVTLAFSRSEYARGATEAAANQQITVSFEDLGVQDPGLLPTSNIYFLKEWGRGFRRLLTLGAVGKARLELMIATEKAAETLKVESNKPDDVQSFVKAVSNYENAEVRLGLRIQALAKSSGDPAVAQFLEAVSERTAWHKKLFDEFKQKHIGQPQYEDIIDATRGKVDQTFEFVASRDSNIQDKAAAEILRAKKTYQVLRARASNADDVAACLAQCRDTYGGSGSAGFDACVRSCNVLTVTGGGGAQALRSVQACAGTEPACSVPQISDCHSGQWVCVGPAQGAGVRHHFVWDSASDLGRAEAAYEAGKYGEAFGFARSAEVHIEQGLRSFEVSHPEFSPTASPAGKTVSFQEQYRAGYRYYMQIAGIDGEAFFKEAVVLEAAGSVAGSVGAGNEVGVTASGTARYSHIILKLGMTKSKVVKEWIEASLGKKYERKSGSITVLEKNGQAGKHYNFFDAFPVSWKVSQLNAESGEYLYEEVQIRAARVESYPIAKPSPRSSPSPSPKAEVSPIVCTQEYAPVCGSDGQTYSNQCMARAAGVQINYPGECKAVGDCDPAKYPKLPPPQPGCRYEGPACYAGKWQFSLICSPGTYEGVSPGQ